ncbi:MAG: hypothetical protein OH338_03330 [Candidatus Parvarchaeota archaeon]|nr:hypothetical protein [Candidatus Parvarchaeum tengchongense]
MKEQSNIRSAFSSLFYGLKSLSELSSFFAFLSITLIIFLLGFVVIFKYLGLGAFLNGGFIFTPSTTTIIAGEFSFVVSFLLIVFSLTAMFYYKLYYLVSSNLNVVSLIKRSLSAFPKFLIATFIQAIISIIGLIALVIPGIYYGSSFMFSHFFSIYGNSTLHSAILNSRMLAKKIRLESLFVFVVYLVLLFVFIYLVSSFNLPEVYSALLYSILLSYWLISYSNTAFNLADKNVNGLSERSSIYRKMLNNS